jgi:RNA polymerase subunit RPABC4/transcription elongation factor Spt4
MKEKACRQCTDVLREQVGREGERKREREIES